MNNGMRGFQVVATHDGMVGGFSHFKDECCHHIWGLKTNLMVKEVGFPGQWCLCAGSCDITNTLRMLTKLSGTTNIYAEVVTEIVVKHLFSFIKI
jgi:hypothetical protein